MLPKELFLSTLEKIQKQEARIDEFNTALSKICDGFPVFDSENQYLIALRELLKYTMQDQYDYIGWWLYGTIKTAEEFKQVLDWCGTYISS